MASRDFVKLPKRLTVKRAIDFLDEPFTSRLGDGSLEMIYEDKYSVTFVSTDAHIKVLMNIPKTERGKTQFIEI